MNRVVTDAGLVQEATAFATKLASGATKAHTAHKAMLRIWATGALAAADEALFDIGLPLFDSEDVKSALPAAIAHMQRPIWRSSREPSAVSSTCERRLTHTRRAPSTPAARADYALGQRGGHADHDHVRLGHLR